MGVNVPFVRVSGTTRIPLDTGWECVAVAPNQFTNPAEVLADTTLAWHAYPCAGRDDADALDWWFRYTSDVPPEPGERAVLVFHGLATLADVWCNTTHVLRSDNMFVTHEIDVTDHISEKTDGMTIMIRCASLDQALTTRRPRPAWRTKLVKHQQLRWIRTTLLGRMPGWSKGPQVVGPWRGVTLERRTTTAIHALHLSASVEATDGIVTFAAELDCAVSQPPLETTLRVGDVSGALHAELSSDRLMIRGELRISDVALWWPHTHGDQPRYPASVSVTFAHHTLTLDLDQIAFRTIALDTTDGQFAIAVNGVPVFCRGACWTTVNPATLSGTIEEYRKALLLARDAGMNMLRVGGTMTYETDAFYALCDELGILVWQDCMFANMDYPFSDPTFLTSVQLEITQWLQRTQTRASLAILCGNSEIEQQTAMLGFPSERWSCDFFQRDLPALCKTWRADIPYWPSSPSGGVFPFHVDAGDAHYFGYGPYLRSFDDVKTSKVRFASETLAFAHIPDLDTIDLLPCGPSGVGHHPEWKAGVPRDNGSSWDFEDVRDHYTAELFGISPMRLRYQDHFRYLALSRVASGEVISRALSEWRRPTSSCHGALLWFYRDFRIGAGWGIVDATGRPKAAYYQFRHAAQPVAVFLSNEGLNGLALTVVNDAPRPLTGTVMLRLYRHGEILVAESSMPVELEPHASLETRADSLLEGFADLSYAYRFGAPNHHLVVATLDDQSNEDRSGAPLHEAYFFPDGIALPQEHDLGLTATAAPLGDGRYQLTITTRRFAQFLSLDIGHFWAEDNYFHLSPGGTRSVVLHPGTARTRLSGPRLSGTVTALNATAPIRIAVQDEPA